MFNIPEKLQCFVPYHPLVGDYKIRLDVNESFIELPPEKIAKAISGVRLNRYPDPYATAAVKAFAGLFGVNPELVTAGNGSDELIAITASSLLQKGDKILCYKPDFSMYAFYSRLYELDVVELQKREDMTVDIDNMIDYINRGGIKCVMFSNPCNPTSLGIEKAEIKRLISGVKALVVLDEAYMDFWNERESLLSEAHNYDNLIVLRTCSKSVALAGIRLGFAVANERITSALKTAKSPFNVNVLSQAIGEVVLSDAEKYKSSIALIKESAARLYSSLKDLNIFEKIYETRTNFVFAKTPESHKIYEYLLSKSIAVRCFDGYLRICAGTEEENKALINALQKNN
ncbi:MAG: histidinol-phosphate aminotransferase family protein [Oscillospiraceae bacterium]|nr:histidinol-phosphate aminotransferase family protein [Oscillospiraceae bacterium]